MKRCTGSMNETLHREAGMKCAGQKTATNAVSDGNFGLQQLRGCCFYSSSGSSFGGIRMKIL